MQLNQSQTPDFFADVKHTHKKVDVIIGVVIALIFFVIAGIFMGIWYFYDEHMEPVNGFLRAIENENQKLAYEYTDNLFKNKVAYDDFGNYLVDKRLDRYSFSEWSEPQINGDFVEVFGDITLVSEVSFPYLVKLHKNEEEWKILSITDVSNDKGIETMTRVEAIAFVRQTMDNFISSVENKSFDMFYKNTSVLLKDSYTKDEFENFFRNFYNTEVYLKDVMAGEVVIDQFQVIDPELNNIIVYGKAFSEVNVLDFEFEILRENNLWRIASIYLSID